METITSSITTVVELGNLLQRVGVHAISSIKWLVTRCILATVILSLAVLTCLHTLLHVVMGILNELEYGIE